MRALFVLALIIGAASAGTIALPGVSASASASASFSASSSSSASSGGSFSSSVKVATPEVKIQKSISSDPCVGAVAPVKKAISSSISAKASSSASASASSSSSSKFSLSQRISRPCEPVRRIAPCVTPTVVQTPCVTPTVFKTPCVTPTIVKTPCVTPTVVQTPCVAPTVIKTPCVTPTIVKTPCVTPTVVKTVAPCVSATASARVAPCTVRRPCARVGCVSAPCVARKQTIFRRKIQPGCGPRAAPLCFRPTADMLRGKDLAVQMLTVRGMQWKCEPTQKEVVEPCETVIVPDPSPCLPFGRVIDRACDKVVAI